ncbi:septum formation family protein [Luteipulveratus flavus]|uniref:septum formation family protein n=1 Tax=Luteipulveratus flavus TaxID=3031728 RepID=UPI0023AEDDD9|nr:septum formation family protein [Luteipulveratus sp. YIM 133132]
MVRRTAAMAVLAAGVMTMTAACGGGDDVSVAPASTATSSAAPTGSAAPSSSSTSESSSPSTTSAAPSTSSSAAAKSFTVGQCLGDKPSYTAIDCSAPHDFEITAVVPSTAHQGDLVKRSAYGTATCNEQTSTYLGTQAWPVTRVQSAPLPSVADPQNASRFVCLTYRVDTSLDKREKVSGSMKGKLAGDGIRPYVICLKGRASQSNDVEFVPCSQPHVSEAVGGKLNGKADSPFPGASKISSDALKFCTPVGQKFLGTKVRKDIVVSQNSGGPGPWSRGQMVTGCFVEVTSGTVSKTLAGIGAKPLTSYR